MTDHESDENRPTLSQRLTRAGLGIFMIGAGVTHLTFARTEFQAQVPEWLPLDKDAVVVGSGVLEIALGLAQFTPAKYRRISGVALAAFYVAIFPGNVAQYIEQNPAFGLDTDGKRLARLYFQPALVAAALWGGGLPRRRSGRGRG